MSKARNVATAYLPAPLRHAVEREAWGHYEGVGRPKLTVGVRLLLLAGAKKRGYIASDNISTPKAYAGRIWRCKCGDDSGAPFCFSCDLPIE